MPPSVRPFRRPKAVLPPGFVPPMLAVPGEAFDSDEHLFEIKWDGTRALSFIDRPGGYRLLNRRRIDMTARYPELDVLGILPPGTVLDGEIVMLPDGKPDFEALQGREHARNPMHIRFAAARNPATYIVFDLLFAGFKSLMEDVVAGRCPRKPGKMTGDETTGHDWVLCGCRSVRPCGRHPIRSPGGPPAIYAEYRRAMGSWGVRSRVRRRDHRIYLCGMADQNHL